MPLQLAVEDVGHFSIHERHYLIEHFHDGYQHTVNSHINRLRKKIELDPANARYILTVWGVGYKFTDPQHEQG